MQGLPVYSLQLRFVFILKKMIIIIEFISRERLYLFNKPLNKKEEKRSKFMFSFLHPAVLNCDFSTEVHTNRSCLCTIITPIIYVCVWNKRYRLYCMVDYYSAQEHDHFKSTRHTRKFLTRSRAVIPSTKLYDAVWNR